MHSSVGNRNEKFKKKKKDERRKWNWTWGFCVSLITHLTMKNVRCEKVHCRCTTQHCNLRWMVCSTRTYRPPGGLNVYRFPSFSHISSPNRWLFVILWFAGCLWHIIAICYYFYQFLLLFSFVCSVHTVWLDLCNHFFFFSW